MSIQGIQKQVCGIYETGLAGFVQFPKFEASTEPDDQAENQRKFEQPQLGLSNLEQFKVQKELYSNQNTKVMLVRNHLDGILQICKITELRSAGQSVSIHLNFQLQFYNKLKQAQTRYLTKINNLINGSGQVIRVMEFACKGDLLHNIPSLCSIQDKNTHLKIIKNILWQVVKGLEEIHGLGFAYRDLKPDNILVNHEGQVILSDFGLVTPLGVIDSSICGTPQYIAPERLSMKRKTSPISASIDTWSLGVLAFQLLMGYTPYSYEDENIQGLLQSMYQGCKGFDTNYPPQCRHFVFNLLQTNPNKRLTLQKIKMHKFFQGVQEQPLQQSRCKCS